MLKRKIAILLAACLVLGATPASVSAADNATAASAVAGTSAAPAEEAPAAPAETTAAEVSAAPAEEVPAAPAEEVPAAPVEEVPAAPAEEAPAAPAEEAPAAPAEEVPAAPAEVPAAPAEEVPATPAAPAEVPATPAAPAEVPATPAAPAEAPAAPAAPASAVSNQAAGTEYTNASGQLVYVVAQNDFLWKIAAKYGITLQEIVAANNLSYPGLLSVGQELIIPTAGQAAAQPAAEAVPAAPARDPYLPYVITEIPQTAPATPVAPLEVIYGPVASPAAPVAAPEAPASIAEPAPAATEAPAPVAEPTTAPEASAAPETDAVAAEEDIPFEGGTPLRDVFTNAGGTLGEVETMEDGIILVTATFNGETVTMSIDPVTTFTGTVAVDDTIAEFGAYINLEATYILEDEFIAALTEVGLIEGDATSADDALEGGTPLNDVFTNAGGTIDEIEEMEDGITLVTATFNGETVTMSIDPVTTFTGTVSVDDTIAEFGAYMNLEAIYILEDEFVAALTEVGIIEGGAAAEDTGATAADDAAAVASETIALDDALLAFGFEAVSLAEEENGNITVDLTIDGEAATCVVDVTALTGTLTIGEVNAEFGVELTADTIIVNVKEFVTAVAVFGLAE